MTKTGKPFNASMIRRFWSKVKKTETCWLWTGVIVGGYGQMGLNNKHIYTHRVSWILANGDVPDRLYVLHNCDIPRCVNPEHLFLGTQKDNSDDKIRKGRARYIHGTQQPNAKLNPTIVAEMRRLYDDGMRFTDIVTKYSHLTCRSNVKYVLNRKAWAHCE